jgi:hypothetical protein
MRRAAFLSLLACLALAGPARAQDEEPAYAPASEAHREGRWSMQFEVGDDFQLTSFNGMGLAVTRNSSLSGAWRLGATLSGRTGTGETTSSSSNDPGPISTNVPLDQRYDFGFELLRLKRFSPDRRIDLELAVGPRIGLIHFKSTEQGDPIGGPGIATQETSLSNQEYGVVGHLGVEVFLARSLSLHAHYGAFAGYRHTGQDVERQESYVDGTSRTVTTEFDLNQWFLSNSGVTLGVSAYL